MVEFRTILDSTKSRVLMNKRFKKWLWLGGSLSVLLIAFGVVILRKWDVDDGLTFILVGVLYTPITYLWTLFWQKRYEKTAMYISDDTEEVYTFDERYITLTQTREDVFTSTLKARYSFIYKVREDRNYFYLDFSKTERHVIDKASIKKGTLEEAKVLLKTNLGAKFKSK